MTVHPHPGKCLLSQHTNGVVTMGKMGGKEDLEPQSKLSTEVMVVEESLDEPVMEEPKEEGTELEPWWPVQLEPGNDRLRWSWEKQRSRQNRGAEDPGGLDNHRGVPKLVGLR